MKTNKTLLLALNLTAICCAQPALGMSWFFGSETKKYYTAWGAPCSKEEYEENEKIFILWKNKNLNTCTKQDKNEILMPRQDNDDKEMVTQTSTFEYMYPAIDEIQPQNDDNPTKNSLVSRPEWVDAITDNDEKKDNLIELLVKEIISILNLHNTDQPHVIDQTPLDFSKFKVQPSAPKAYLINHMIKAIPNKSTQKNYHAYTKKITSESDALNKVHILLSMMNIQTRIKVLAFTQPEESYIDKDNEIDFESHIVVSELWKLCTKSTMYEDALNKLYSMNLIPFQIYKLTTIKDAKKLNATVKKLLLKNPCKSDSPLNETAHLYLDYKFFPEEEKGHLYSFAKKNNHTFILNCYEKESLLKEYKK